MNIIMEKEKEIKEITETIVVNGTNTLKDDENNDRTNKL